jgi:hypothetical protein
MGNELPHDLGDHGQYVAGSIAEGNNLIAFHLLMSAEANVVAALLRGRCRAVAVNGRGIEKISSIQGEDRSCKNCIKTAVRLPESEHPINARVMNFRMAVLTDRDRQFLPLTTHVQQPQDVVENRMRTQFW